MGSAWPRVSSASLLGEQIWEDTRVLWATAILVVALLVGALVIALVDRWRKRLADSQISSGEQLTHFRSLYERGELNQEEYDRIRARLGQRIRQELNVPGSKPTTGAPPAESPDSIRPAEPGL